MTLTPQPKGQEEWVLFNNLTKPIVC